MQMSDRKPLTYKLNYIAIVQIFIEIYFNEFICKIKVKL